MEFSEPEEEEEEIDATKEDPPLPCKCRSGYNTILKTWLLSPEHFKHPYPTAQELVQLMQQTGLNKKQLLAWFKNAKLKIWKPIIEKLPTSLQLNIKPKRVCWSKEEGFIKFQGQMTDHGHKLLMTKSKWIENKINGRSKPAIGRGVCQSKCNRL